MKNLIQITEHDFEGKLVQTVNARELHIFLESRQDFSTWIKKRLEKLRLQENKDFCTAPQTYGTANGGNSTRLEYHVTLDIAKHIAMMENTDRGFEVRDYFIECEKRLQEKNTLPITYLEAMKALVKELEEKEINKPKITYYDTVLQSSSLTTITEIAKDYGLSAIKLNSILKEEKVQYKNQSGVWMLYTKYVPLEYAQTVTVPYELSDGAVKNNLYLKWTQKGRVFIHNLLKEKGILPICEREGKI